MNIENYILYICFINESKIFFTIMYSDISCVV